MRKGSIGAIKNTTARRAALCVVGPILVLAYCWSYLFLVPWHMILGAIDGARDEASRIWWSYDFRLFRAGIMWMWADDYHTNSEAAMKRATDAVRP